MAPSDNDIQHNIDNDQDKDYRLQVYVNEPLRDAVHAYADRMDMSKSDACGKLLREALKSRIEGLALAEKEKEIVSTK